MALFSSSTKARRHAERNPPCIDDTGGNLEGGEKTTF
jgi:hypothetical protein